MARDTIDMLTARASDADLVLIEGSMGLFDGVATSGRCGTGASADLAEMPALGEHGIHESVGRREVADLDFIEAKLGAIERAQQEIVDVRAAVERDALAAERAELRDR